MHSEIVLQLFLTVYSIRNLIFCLFYYILVFLYTSLVSLQFELLSKLSASSVFNKSLFDLFIEINFGLLMLATFWI